MEIGDAITWSLSFRKQSRGLDCRAGSSLLEGVAVRGAQFSKIDIQLFDISAQGAPVYPQLQCCLVLVLPKLSQNDGNERLPKLSKSFRVWHSIGSDFKDDLFQLRFHRSVQR